MEKRNKIIIGAVVGCVVLIILSTLCAIIAVMVGAAALPWALYSTVNEETIINDEDTTNSNTTKGEEVDPERLEMAEKVMDETSDLRGIDYDFDDVVMTFLSPEDLVDKIYELEDRDEEDKFDVILAQDILYKALRTIPADTDVEQLMKDYYGEDLLGFYDPVSKEFYIKSEEGDMSAMEKYTVSHEFIHYLQDQEFDLEALDDLYDPYTEGNEDIYQAYSALVEGDATMGSGLYIYTMDQDEFTELQEEASNYEPTVELPNIIEQSMSFSYNTGYLFVYEAYGTEFDYSSVDDIYTDVPQSTEQILHPEKYFEDRDNPSDIVVPDETLEQMDEELGDDYERLYTSTCLGELDTWLILDEYLSTERAQVAAAGWDGNATALWFNESTSKYVIQMMYAWDTEADRSEFEAAFTRYCTDAGHSTCEFTASGTTSDGSTVLSLVEMRGKLDNLFVPTRD